MFKIKGLIIMFSLLGLVLYCSQKHGDGKELADYSQQMLIEPPEWVSGGVMYQVFPRVFTPGGDFKSLENNLEKIESLGVDIIWLMPIFPIGEKGRKGTVGSPFAIENFMEINPDYGTKDDFRSLVNAIHERGMKVIVGMVPNHGANDNHLMADHPDWFFKDETGNFSREVADWSDITDFNYDNPEMRAYMVDVYKYWIQEFDIDGYRCDVAGMVPYDFWKNILVELRQIKPDIYFLAEWEDPKILLQGFNSDYGWTEFHTLKSIRNGKKRTVEIIDEVAEKEAKYPQNKTIMRFLENHDEQRSFKTFGMGAIEAYATTLFTMPGIPLIYAGQEIGELEKPSLFEKSELDWENANNDLREFYRSLILLRKSHSCFTAGEFVPLQIANYNGSAGVFARIAEDNAAIVVLNLRNIPVEKLVVTMKENIRNKLNKFNFKNYKTGEMLNFEEIYFEALPGYSAQVFISESSAEK